MAGIENEITGRRRRGGIISHVAVDVIKWESATSEESALIVHKFEKEDFPNSSQLIVAPSQIAVFINNLAEERGIEVHCDTREETRCRMTWKLYCRMERSELEKN